MTQSIKKIGGVLQASVKNIARVNSALGLVTEFPLINDANLIGYWKLDGNNVDSKGGLSATDSNITYGTGKFGQGAAFNGASSKIDITNSANYDVSNLTISAWVYSTNFSQNGFIFEKGSVNTQYALFLEGGNISFRTVYTGWGGSNWALITTYAPVSLLSNSNWHHIVATYNGTQKKIYVDGDLVSSVAYSQAMITGQSGERIGAYGGASPAYWFNGTIDDVSVFSRALTYDEIAKLYDTNIRRVALIQNTFKPTDIANCKVWIDASRLDLNGGDDVSALTDLSGNGNNLAQRTVSQNPHYTPQVGGKKPGMQHTAAASSTWDIPWTYNAPCTFFYVGRMTTAGSNNSRLLSGKNNNWLMGFWGGFKRQAYFNGWVGANSDNAADANLHIWSAVVNSTSYLWQEGTLVKSGTGGVTAPSGLTIGYQGTSEFSDGSISEIIGYDRELSTAERQLVETYLGLKYGVTMNPTLLSATGGAITVAAGKTVHTFTSSGSFVVTGSGTVQVLVVGGGGGGGGTDSGYAGSGGGGGGGVVYNSAYSVTAGTYTVTIGGGGGGGTGRNNRGSNGGNSVFGSITAYGGGGGGCPSGSSTEAGIAGGCGGGGARNGAGGGGSQGGAGGNSADSNPYRGAGGGGGGANGNAGGGSGDGHGGIGYYTTIRGSGEYFAGGGSGGRGGTGGGAGGGGNAEGGSGSANTGGGGAGTNSGTGGTGGTGIVIIAYS